MWVMILVGVLIGLASGSKEILFEIVLAMLLSNLLPALRMGGRLNRQNLHTLAAIAGVGALLLLVAFPAITAFRHQVQRGASFFSSVAGTPGELVQDSIILGTPRADPSFVGYMKDAGLYATTRTSGFDELLITVAAPQNPDILTTQSLLLMPLGGLRAQQLLVKRSSRCRHFTSPRITGARCRVRTRILPSVFSGRRT